MVGVGSVCGDCRDISSADGEVLKTSPPKLGHCRQCRSQAIS